MKPQYFSSFPNQEFIQELRDTIALIACEEFQRAEGFAPSEPPPLESIDQILDACLSRPVRSRGQFVARARALIRAELTHQRN